MNKLIRVIAPGPLGSHATIVTSEGVRVPGVTSCQIRIEPDDVITAELQIRVEAVDVMALPLLGLETIRAAALAHGFTLVPTREAAA